MLEKYNAPKLYSILSVIYVKINRECVGLVSHATSHVKKLLVIASVKIICTMYLFIGIQCNRPNEDQECY